MVRTRPPWRHAKALVDSGELGDARAISGWFSYYNDDAANVRTLAGFGGGGLLDIGCYLEHCALHFRSGTVARRRHARC